MTNETAENLRRAAHQRVATEGTQKRAQERAQQRAQAPVTVSPPDQVLLGYADLRALGNQLFARTPAPADGRRQVPARGHPRA